MNPPDPDDPERDAATAADDIGRRPRFWERMRLAIGDGLALDDDGERDVDADRKQRHSRGIRWMSLAVAAAVLVAAVMATQVVSLHHRLDRSPLIGESAAASAFAHAARSNGSRLVALSPDAGRELARIVVLPDGSGYLKNDRMARLDDRHTYQLWALTGAADATDAVSVGVLGPHPKAAAFQASTDVRTFVITVERTPGVARLTQPPVATGRLT